MEISSALGKIWLITRPAGISGKIRFDKDGSRRGWVFSHLIIRSSKDEWTARKVREILRCQAENAPAIVLPAKFAACATHVEDEQVTENKESGARLRSAGYGGLQIRDSSPLP